MAVTYEPIGTYTAPSSVASYTFSSIPQTYTDLVLIANGAISANGDVGLRFNGDTATNYGYTRIYGNGSATACDKNSTTDYIPGASWYSATTNNTACIHIMNYTNTTAYKPTLMRGNSTSTMVSFVNGIWASTAAITSVTVISPGGSTTYSAGTTFTLYGIKAA